LVQQSWLRIRVSILETLPGFLVLHLHLTWRLPLSEFLALVRLLCRDCGLWTLSKGLLRAGLGPGARYLSS
jgi:hypothetical protein